MIAGSSLFFQWFIWNLLCLSLWTRAVKILISNWPRTRKFSQFFKKYRRGRPFLTMVTRWSRSTSSFVLWLVKIWQVSSCVKFMQHLEKCLLWQLKLAEFCVNLCLFPLNVQNEIQLLSRVFCYSWLVCLLGFWLRNASLFKIRYSYFRWHLFRFSPCLMRERV